jgi:segregation and condensation protein A
VSTQDYRVRLDAFEGPLDLLLYLIRRAEVDITDIPISALTDQYLEHLAELDREHVRIDIELAGEFLVMAATLMEIKSQMLVPRAPGDGASDGEERPAIEGDPRADLVRQLLAYKKFRDLADGLERRREEWARRVPASAAGIDDDALREAMEATGEIHIDDLNLNDLVEAYRRVASMLNFERLGDHQVTYDDTPIELHAADIIDRLRRDGATVGGMPFSAIFAGRARPEMVGLFLAMLELIRRQEVRIGLSTGMDGATEIQVRLGDDPEPQAPDVVVPPRAGATETSPTETGVAASSLTQSGGA